MNSPLAYIGGKSKLAPEIIKLFPETYDTYCEMFSGAAWVFFKKEPTSAEVLNDLDGDLICFYRVLQNHLEEFLRQFKWALASRELFTDWGRQIKAEGLTDIQRSARYYYIQRLAFGGRVKDRTFGASCARRPKINLLRLEENLSEIHLRLCNATIENLPYQKLVARYDRPGTFFYCDPPYFKAPYYKHNMKSVDEYAEMAQLLMKISGRFILSINDCEEMRQVFKGFQIRPVTLKYSVAKNKPVTGKELLIMNY
ncbi:restriction endonuclease subunit M [Desulfonema ishimotonii]|uniref:site-specific DNA-methyltransferase (adenine-specific) n=1 Tax=Desulfonema ishimotonii TaxID=45657 RepID=A0A401G004_9BACT|nr:DNA adenine methylase [Desulfonema ishimotonii]GBC62527.1 restriction endonuclease subunit M [Desulfonema ishimotonii]